MKKGLMNTVQESAGRSRRMEAEPSFEAMAAMPIPKMVGPQSIALRDQYGETGVNWDGSLTCRPLDLFEKEKPPAGWLTRLKNEQWQSVIKGRGSYLSRFNVGFGYGRAANSHVPIGADPEALRRRLIDGCLPGADIAYYSQLQDAVYDELAFTVPVPGTNKKPLNVIGIKITNQGIGPLKTRLIVRFGWRMFKRVAPDKGVFINRPVRRTCRARGRVIYDEQRRPILICGRAGAVRFGLENTIAYDVLLAPGAAERFVFYLPVSACSRRQTAAIRRYPFEQALADFRKYWKAFLGQGMQVSVPEPLLNNLYRNLLAQCALSADGNIMYYGTYPGGYDDSLFGVEETWTILALAYWGRRQDAGRYLTHTIINLLLSHFFKSSPNRHGVHGNALRAALEYFQIAQDPRWAKKHLAVLKECGKWIVEELRSNMPHGRKPRSPHWGLLPKFSVGGDIGDHQIGYALWPNAFCWRGLRDLGILLSAVDGPGSGGAYQALARDYRARIRRAFERSIRRVAGAPVMPLQLYERQWARPVPASLTESCTLMGEYYQIFSSCILHSGIFGYDTRPARVLRDYLEKSNRLFLGLPRWNHGIDAEYSLGWLTQKLAAGRTDEFLRGFYAYLAHGMDREVFTFPEVRPLKPRRGDLSAIVPGMVNRIDPASVEGQAFRDRRSVLNVSPRSARVALVDSFLPAHSAPCSASLGVILLLLRQMLVLEEKDAEDLPTGWIILGQGLPRRWLENGRSISVRKAPAFFGRISYTMRSNVAEGRITVTIAAALKPACRGIIVHVRHPGSARIKKVILNGRRHRDFDAGAETVRLPGLRRATALHVYY